MCSRLFLQLSFSFLESNAIFTDLSFFTVITTGETKLLHIHVLLSPGVRFLLVSPIFSRRLLVDVMGSVLLFVSPDSVPVLVEC